MFLTVEGVVCWLYAELFPICFGVYLVIERDTGWAGIL